MRSRLAWIGLLTIASVVVAAPAKAQRIENQVAIFAALDKVTARIQKLEVKLGETQKFGALKITPRTCYSRPPTEPPKTTTFVEVDEIDIDGKQKRLFSGWMFAESPGLNAVEHPVYDVWLTECAVPKTAPVASASSGRPGAAATKQGTGGGQTGGPTGGQAGGQSVGQSVGQTQAPVPAADDDPNARRRRPPR
jgi:hypothetical protein